MTWIPFFIALYLAPIWGIGTLSVMCLVWEEYLVSFGLFVLGVIYHFIFVRVYIYFQKKYPEKF